MLSVTTLKTVLALELITGIAQIFMSNLINEDNMADFIQAYETAKASGETLFFFEGEYVETTYADHVVAYLQPTELEHSIISALRNPDNDESMVLMPVMFDGIRTADVCSIDDNSTSPMVVVINDELFDRVKPIADITDFLSNLK